MSSGEGEEHGESDSENFQFGTYRKYWKMRKGPPYETDPIEVEKDK